MDTDTHIKDLTILLVEDEAVVAFDVTQRLKMLGYPAPHVVPSGEKALEVAQEITPDIVLMDIMLAGELDGIDTATKLRAMHDIPIIYLTSFTDPSLLQRAQLTGPFGYVLKPCKDRELHICIEMALYKHATERKQIERERLFSTTLCSIREAVITIDKQQQITFCNPAAEELLKKSAYSLEDAPVEKILALHVEGEDRPLSPEELVERHAQTARLALTGSMCCGDIQCPVEISASAILNETATMGIVLVLRDLTRRRAHEAHLAKVLDDLQRVLEQTVMAIAVTFEKRDPYTAGHQQRVSALAVAIAKQLGMDEHFCQGLRMAGLLHDIGKIYVPSEMLSKPVALSKIEQTIMHTHPQVGYDILKGVEFPWPVAQMVIQHHERMDGSGYPQGLCGSQILLGARILAVSDVVEAMASHRPYRPALGLDTALEEIKSGKNTLYWDAAVDACLTVFVKNFKFPAAHPGIGSHTGEINHEPTSTHSR